MILVHGSNLEQKERHPTKYRDQISRAYLAEIRIEYDKWCIANTHLTGPKSMPNETDLNIITERVRLFEDYKKFLDQQKYAEKFDSRSNLHSSALEEFLYYLFRDLVADFGSRALIGKSHTFKDVFFMPTNYKSMINRPHASIERKDHDFVIGVTVEVRFQTSPQTDNATEEANEQKITEPPRKYEVQIEGQTEKHLFDIPAVAIECKTYLDK